MFTSKRKLLTIEDKPIDDPESIKDIILLQANRWLAIHYPDHKTALLTVEIYSGETSLGKYQPSNQTIHINSVLVKETEAARLSLQYYAGYIQKAYLETKGLVERLDLIDPSPENYWSKTLPDIEKKIQALPFNEEHKLLGGAEDGEEM